VHAQEEDCWLLGLGCALGVGEGLEALAGESLSADDDPSGDGSGRGQLAVAVEQQRLDGLGAEDAAEFGVQVAGSAVQAHPLGLGHDMAGH
jgi:hypothetical protein